MAAGGDDPVGRGQRTRCRSSGARRAAIYFELMNRVPVGTRIESCANETSGLVDVESRRVVARCHWPVVAARDVRRVLRQRPGEVPYWRLNAAAKANSLR